MRKTALSAIIFLLFNFQFTISAQVASEGEMLAPGKVGTDDMIAVFADDVSEGDYEIAVESSSSMFRIAQSILHVKDGSMSATLTMGGKGYAKLFLGTAQEASDANGEGDILRCPPTDVQEISQNADAVVFEIPVSALNTPIKCAAYSVKKKKWYDRDILFDASSLPSEKLLVYPKKAQKTSLKDGAYSANVLLTGGSGRGSITNPVKLTVKDGYATALIEWSSPNYDYMTVNREKFLPDSKILKDGGNSTFLIPIPVFDGQFPVAADTVAMSTPHEIHYLLRIDSSSVKKEGSFPKSDLILLIWAALVVAGVLFARQKMLSKGKR